MQYGIALDMPASAIAEVSIEGRRALGERRVTGIRRPKGTSPARHDARTHITVCRVNEQPLYLRSKGLGIAAVAIMDTPMSAGPATLDILRYKFACSHAMNPGFATAARYSVSKRSTIAATDSTA